MPTQKNKIVKSISPKSVFEEMSGGVSSSLTCDQGDFLYLTSNAIAIASGSGELGTNFLGVSRVSLISGVPPSPIQGTDVDDRAGIPALAGPVYGVTSLVVLKSGDSVSFGDKLYPDGGAGNRHVTTTAGSKKVIGVYQGASATGDGSAEIEVLIGAQYPSGAFQS